MTTLRQELETRLDTFAKSIGIPVSYENVPFTKPQTPWIECSISSTGTTNVTTDGHRTRERGTFQVNVWSVSGKGMGQIDQIVDGLIAAFPVIPKIGTVSIEQTPSRSRAVLDISGYVISAVTIMYRQEGVA